MSRGAREAKNELKAGLFGSDKSVFKLTKSESVTVFGHKVMSASEKMFP